ncbi:DNA topoisomerase I, bacterial [Desulfosporosinus orientis DSM 765]|uniref:DNA topoisomerase 1 n=1 Tax=Desulfosporosinus orientis (strain ATCC 19365 / DSM 765 / NCIMB 8382 / VKM B-1628 / Singapore I) TaxID=768706 RepID=G7WE83_DESOD|nr:type I DNA topoisomerase [Desulfosporosinus orientis]AET70059.1 DNA topoisomerase I, bacterial [Desulfosporosinus orientis DSM 765]
MSKTLVIVESPAKAKSISKFLGSRYTVKASMGHLRDLPKSQMGVDLENDFEPKYIAIRGRGDLIKELRAAAKSADRVFLASDPDREGEAIAWHLSYLLGLEQTDKIRIEFHEITKQAIQTAIKHSRHIDQDRVDAQQARRVLDRLVGYQLSPLLWRKIKKGLSAGRVQSVAVRLIDDREEEIRAFVSEEYWSLTAELQFAGGKFLAKLVKKSGKKISISNRTEMETVLEELKGKEFKVSDVRTKEKKRLPAPPFTTSSLQQEAHRKLGFSPKRTMMLAQQLYEGLDLGKEGTVGLITYMRTDSVKIADIAQTEAKEWILGNYGGDYYPPEPRQFTTKGRAQEAHEAIRPTLPLRTPDALKGILSRDQLRLYRLIWERFMASQMSVAVVDTLTVESLVDEYLFRANASTVRFPGFLAIYEEGNDDTEAKDEEQNSLTISVSPGEQLKLIKLQEKQHFTEPPPRYTEASLVRKMEEEGIGRPSTYAPTIETIQTRGYVVKEEKQLLLTELGDIVITLLKEHFPDIVNLEFTANLEEKLDLIEEGKAPWKAVVEEYYQPFSVTLAEAEEKIGKVKIEDQVSEEICENCGRNMVIKMGRYGKFLACPGFPECRNTKPLFEEVGTPCPNCSKPLVVRRSKKGRKFYGCLGYPECDFVSWEMPAPEPCPECGQLMVVKSTKRQKKHVCTNRECRHTIVIEEEG